jgi:nucleoside-triphosphatase THEP1
VIYRDSTAAARLLARAADALFDAGHICAGFVQKDEVRAGWHRCHMSLVDLATGECIPISEDRGPGARGCQLDADGLMSAIARALAAVSDDTSIVIINKFGKSEAEGEGFRPLIECALEHGIPVLIGVPWRNIESWREFAGELSGEVDAESIAALFGEPLLALLGLTSEATGSCSAAADCGQESSRT